MDDKWSIDKLGSHNYSTWKFKLKHLLIAKELFGYVDGTIEQPDEGAAAAAKADYAKKSSKAFSSIVLAVGDELLYLITDCTTGKAAWDKLQGHFERDSLANKLFLKKQYFRTVMKDGTPMELHFKHMTDITNKLAAIRAPISEEDQVVTLLGSLPETFSTVVTALEARGDDLSLDFVQQTLLNEEQKRREQSLLVSGVRNTHANSDAALSAGRTNNVVCWNCNLPGHVQSQCPDSKRSKPKQQRRNRSHKAKQAAETDGNGSDEFALVSGGSSNTDNNNVTIQRWLIDSGATRHMTPCNTQLTDYKPFDQPEKVAIADGHIVDAVGTGNVKVNVRVGRKVSRKATLYDVLYVPDLKQNLFSVKSTTDKGMIVQFGHTRCWVKNKRGQVCAMGTLVDKLYYLDLESSDHSANVASTNNLWHQRLAHVNQATMKRMHCDKVVTGVNLDLSNANVDTCEPCIKGKMTRKPFKSTSGIKSSRVLELVHTDVCGPMQNLSIGGSRYIVTFIDDFSRYTHVYCVKEKSDVFSRFKEFEALVTNETGQTIGTLRSDNGGEYVSSEFENYLKSRGIRHQLTVRHTPQQNGVAERYNRTVYDAARAMIIQAKVPKTFWAEAIATAVYVRNRVPTSSHKQSTTPYEIWYGVKPDLSHLRVFGCVAYAHIPEELRRKLDDKAATMTFVGYSTKSKAYRLYDPATHQIVRRRDVICDEQKFGIPVTVGNDNSKEVVVNVSENQESSPRRSDRTHRAPVRYGYDEYATHTVHHVACHASDVIEPVSMAEAKKSPQSEQWMEAAQSEYKSLTDNKTWTLVDLPQGRKAIGNKWVFKAKCTTDGVVDRYKARLVAKGFSQKPGVDYYETYAPVVHRSSLRSMLSYAVSRGMLIHQMDVVTAFLNGYLSEEIYMAQPEGFVVAGKEHLVCKLERSLYGLKQSPRCWNEVLDEFLKSLSFVQSSADHCVYIRDDSSVKVMIAVYVDDLVIMSDTEESMVCVKQSLASRFQMKDLGKLHFCLGISACEDGDSLKLHQKHFIEQMLCKYNMDSCKPASTPMAVDVKLVKDDGSKPVDPTKYQSIVGSLLYIATATRPDISYAVGALSKFNSSPTETHLTAAKRVLRYLRGTADLGIVFSKTSMSPIGFSDASWADDDENRRSTSGHVFIHGEGPISWSSRRQSVTALSTAEAEYIAAFDATKEAAWLRMLYADLTGSNLPPTTLNIDNQSAISIANNATTTRRSKHMDIRYHYIRDEIARNHIDTVYCPTNDMLADIFTKPLARDRFVRLRNMLHIV